MQYERLGNLRDPAVVIAFSGWNDAGNAASDSALYFLEKYPNEELGRIDDERYYDFQATRPNVRRSPDGPWLQWPHTTLQLVRHPDRDLIVVVGPEPSLLWRSFVRDLVQQIKAVAPGIVVLLGAMLSDTPHSRPLPVNMYSYDPDLQARFGLSTSEYEGPTGIVGVINQVLMSENVPTVSLWVSVPHYVATPPNPKAQHAVLTQLSDALEIAVDLDDLPAEADKWTAAVDELSQEDPDVAEYIEQLEEAKDASDVEGATGDAIAAEFERYLRGRGEGRRGDDPWNKN
ncbi:PAC2 family protein [Tessaracoccus sp. OS52]|uniref:PAC2 family protein n=1 Tax=Tessaracoccus sp. OS52 TaxID=2886691 RepID=UPI001D121790|nr:PAC2 family protein [Tessaracoccus sp. OS52]MCC2592950.1 PAC2 family protein [Tessaracoccus sp. OS52]